MKTLNYHTDITVPVEQIDLYHWLINISEEDYKRFSKDHIAIGLCRKNGAEGMINVESIGGNLLVQHYTIVEKERDHVFLYSEKSEAYLFHFVKVYIKVEWKMSVKFKDENTSTFTCELNIKYPNKALPVAAKLTAGDYFLRKHLNEEGKNFAADIERKFSNTK